MGNIPSSLFRFFLGFLIDQTFGGFFGSIIGFFLEAILTIQVCLNFAFLCPLATTAPPSPDIRETSFVDSLRSRFPVPTPAPGVALQGKSVDLVESTFLTGGGGGRDRRRRLVMLPSEAAPFPSLLSTPVASRKENTAPKGHKNLRQRDSPED